MGFHYEKRWQWRVTGPRGAVLSYEDAWPMISEAADNGAIEEGYKADFVGVAGRKLFSFELVRRDVAMHDAPVSVDEPWWPEGVQ